MFAEHFDRFHYFGVSDGFGGHQELELVDAGSFMEFGGLDAAFGIAGDDNAALRQSVGVKFLPDFLSQRGAAGQVHGAGLTGFRVWLHLNVAGEVLLQVLGDTAPLVQQAGVHVFLILDVGTSGAEEGFQRVGAEFSGG